MCVRLIIQYYKCYNNSIMKTFLTKKIKNISKYYEHRNIQSNQTIYLMFISWRWFLCSIRAAESESVGGVAGRP